MHMIIYSVSLLTLGCFLTVMGCGVRTCVAAKRELISSPPPSQLVS